MVFGTALSSNTSQNRPKQKTKKNNYTSTRARENNRKFNRQLAKQLATFKVKTRRKVVRDLNHLEPPSYRDHLVDEAVRYWIKSYPILKTGMIRRGYGPGRDSEWVNFLAVASGRAGESSEVVADGDADVPGRRGEGVDVNGSREKKFREQGQVVSKSLFSVVTMLVGLRVVFLIFIPTYGWQWEMT